MIFEQQLSVENNTRRNTYLTDASKYIERCRYRYVTNEMITFEICSDILAR